MGWCVARLAISTFGQIAGQGPAARCPVSGRHCSVGHRVQLADLSSHAQSHLLSRTRVLGPARLRRQFRPGSSPATAGPAQQAGERVPQPSSALRCRIDGRMCCAPTHPSVDAGHLAFFRPLLVRGVQSQQTRGRGNCCGIEGQARATPGHDRTPRK